MNSQDQSSFQQWLQESYLSEDLKNSIRATQEAIQIGGEIVSNVSTVIGIFGAIVKLVEVLSFERSGPDELQKLANIVVRVETTLRSLAAWNAAASWTTMLAELSATTTLISDFLVGTGISVSPGPGLPSRPGLLSDADRLRALDHLIQPLRNVRDALLAPTENGVSNFQESLFFKAQYLFPLSESAFEPVDPVALGVPNLPGGVPPLTWIGHDTEGALIWDYRYALPHIVRTVTQLIICFRIYDPAFRTTRRFNVEIDQLVGDLDIFAARWLQCLAWTKNLPLEPPEYKDSDVPESVAPMAIDTRSRAAVSYDSPSAYFQSMPGEPEYSRRRLDLARKLLLYSGFVDFRAWTEQIRKLTTLPTKTESIGSDVRISGGRTLVKKTTLAVQGGQRVVKIQHADWLVSIDLTVQPQIAPYDYAHGRPIHYEFFLESYESMSDEGAPQSQIDRIHLAPGQDQRQTIKCNSPEIWVPGEDDGTYGDERTPHTQLRQTLNPSSKVPAHPVNALLTDFRALAPTTDEGETRIADTSRISNRFLSRFAEFSKLMVGSTVVMNPPPMTVVNAQRKPITIGCSLEFGPTGDLRQGIASFRAWNLDGEDSNVGALFLVIEETPPFEHKPIPTRFALPLNPTEIWFAAFSRTGPREKLIPQ